MGSSRKLETFKVSIDLDREFDVGFFYSLTGVKSSVVTWVSMCLSLGLVLEDLA